MTIPGDKTFDGNVTILRNLEVQQDSSLEASVHLTALATAVFGAGRSENLIPYSDNYAHWAKQRIAVTGAVAYDGGTYTDETAAANDSTANDMHLLPATVEVDDAYYFGGSVPWRSMVLNVGQAGDGDWTLVWEYWNGSAWTELSNVHDGTNGFRNAGEGWIHFDLPSDWQECEVASISAYWIRARVSSVTTTNTQPLGTQAWLHDVDFTWDGTGPDGQTCQVLHFRGAQEESQASYEADLGTDLDDRTFVFSVWVKGSATGIYLELLDAVGSDVVEVHPTEDGWVRAWVRRTCPEGAGTKLWCRIRADWGHVATWRCQLEEAEVPGVPVYTSGAAASVSIVPSVMYLQGDYGGNFANFTPPQGREGALLVARDYNSTNPGHRLYVFSGGQWRYVDLTS